MTSEPPRRSGLAPLYLAGFTTAFGAHGVASVLGSESEDIGLSLLGLGAVLALYVALGALAAGGAVWGAARHGRPAGGAAAPLHAG
ncbi:hypothetical protein [Microbacterium jejuense]|uniref:hypothetical protein n=1 Tax=Microbacterium jejuense TaxID=1263637 RepID=UPI0031E7BC9E